jgi:hypothetical protein
VDAMTDSTRSSHQTVGGAIEIMEENMARWGIELTINANHKAGGKEEEMEGKEPVLPGKLARLWVMEYLGMTHAFDTGRATKRSVGKVSTMEALVPGNVVALYAPHFGTFLRISDENADFGGGGRNMDELPIEWDSERFLVVDAGRGRVAFLNPKKLRFFGIVDGSSGLATAKGFAITHLDDRPRGNESFLPVSVSDESNDLFRLQCSSEDAYLKVPPHEHDDNQFLVVKIHGCCSE